MVRPRQVPKILVWKAPRSLGTIMGNDFPGGWHRVLKLSAAVVCSDFTSGHMDRRLSVEL